MMKRILTPTLIAFTTALFIVPAASAMPMTDTGKTSAPRAFVVPTTNLTDGWYSAAVQQTPLTDGWYSAVVATPAVSTPHIAPPTSSTSPTRTIVLLLALCIVLAAALTATVRRTRRERHVPVLQ